MFNCSETADLHLLMCILSFQGSATHLFLAPLSFLKEEHEQHILSKGTVLCAVSGIHDEQLNHAVGESQTGMYICCCTHARARHACTHAQQLTQLLWKKQKCTYLNLVRVVKNTKTRFTWRQDGLRYNTEDDIMKNTNHHKNAPPSLCPFLSLEM